ncbi:hypothetical protein CEXT_306351, partial [Caerostris extrusa]
SRSRYQPLTFRRFAIGKFLFCILSFVGSQRSSTFYAQSTQTACLPLTAHFLLIDRGMYLGSVNGLYPWTPGQQFKSFCGIHFAI